MKLVESKLTQYQGKNSNNSQTGDGSFSCWSEDESLTGDVAIRVVDGAELPDKGLTGELVKEVIGGAKFTNGGLTGKVTIGMPIVVMRWG